MAHQPDAQQVTKPQGIPDGGISHLSLPWPHATVCWPGFFGMLWGAKMLPQFSKENLQRKQAFKDISSPTPKAPSKNVP